MGHTIISLLTVFMIATGLWNQRVQGIPGIPGGGCDRFPASCPTECTALDDMGCLNCLCHAAGISRNNTAPSQTGSVSAQTGINLSGCPRLRSDCNFDCLSIGSNGCIMCTCKPTVSGSMASLTGGATLISSGSSSSSSQSGNTQQPKNSTNLTGSSTLHLSGSGSGAGTGSVSGVYAKPSNNNNGCPHFPVNCDPSCAQLDNAGCPNCVCNTGAGANSSNSQGSKSQSSLTSSLTSQNLNGCPPFSKGCTANCLGLDSNGCPVCSCPKQGSSSSTSHHMTSGASANANGCPVFMSTCRQECVTLDGHGCPICFCDHSKGNTGTGTNSTSGHVTSHLPMTGSMGNNNGCPAFPTNCRPDCLTLSNSGCPMCTCTAPTDNLASTPPTKSSGGGGHSTECPPLVAHCNEACLWTDRQGCVMCNGDCNGKFIKNSSNSNNGSNTAGSITTTKAPVNSGSGGSTVMCAAFDGAHCNPACLRLDSNGCLTCTCNSNTSPTPNSAAKQTTAAPNQITPAASNNITGSGVTGNANGCLPFDVNCSPGCAGIDANGCLSCLCGPQTTPKPSGKVTLPPLPSGTTFAPIIPGGSTVTSGVNNTAGNGNGCPQFDTSCAQTCIRIDSMGCLTCNCQGPQTTPKPNGKITLSPLLSGTTFVPIIPGGNTGTSGVNHTAGNGNGCPHFDASCAQNCIHIDSMGCLTCNCPESKKNATGSSGNTGSGNSNGCPKFNLECPPGCASIDAQGCLTCTCTGTAGAPEVTTPRGTGNANNCPAVNIFQCQPSCLKLDKNGCLLCECQVMKSSTIGTPTKPTTLAPVTMTTTIAMETSKTAGIAIPTKPTTTHHTPVTARCPKFDMSCPGSCTQLDQHGCLVCACPAPTTTTTQGTTVTTQATTNSILTTTPKAIQNVCPPIRCVYPCDAGVSLAADNCPVCQCRTTTTKP